MARSALVAALLAALCAIVAAQQSYQGEACPWYQVDPTHFNATAFLPLYHFSTCQQYRREACCKVTYVDRVASLSDDFSTTIYNRLNYSSSSSECQRFISLLACLPCSPYSDSVATVNQYATTVRVCGSFCDTMYTACGSTGISGGGDTVATAYSDGTDFCFNLLALANWHADVRPNADDTCFADKPECTRADYVGEYTPCNANGTRSVFWAKKEDSECEAGLPLPAPIHNLPCRVPCNGGSYLPVGQKSCARCAAGTFSIGGGYRVEEFGGEWPENWDVESYCAMNEGDTVSRLECGWFASEDGDTISSGHINDSMSSVLEIRTLFVRPGTVRFSYKVDAEPKFDGLMFFIDNVKVMNLTSNTNGFELFTADVSAGYHRFGWRYYKDLTITEGEDQAVLRMIEFEGTAWADDFCTPCPVGQFSLTGAIDCIPCPFGTYANQTGTAMCAVCPEGTYAYEESAECSPKPPCTADDYATIVAPCSNNQRVRSYRWTAPQICDPELAQSVPLPADETIACAPCPGGTVNTGGVCVACPNGFARAWNEQQCSPCPAGTAALKSQHFHTWDAWDNAFFDTFCEGECGTDGWRLLSEAADSGVGHGHSVSSILRLRVSMSVRGSLTFNATMMCDVCTLEVEDVGSAAYSYGSKFKGASTVPLAPGDHTVLFKFEKYDPHRQNRNDRVVLYSVSVDGTTTGGSRQCVTCPAGSAAPAQSAMCSNCTAGTFAPGGTGTCEPCPANTFSDTDAAASCFPCGANSAVTTPPGSTECLYDCKFNNGNVSFDLSPLVATGDMWGPIYDDRDHGYLFNPCSTRHQNHSCFDAQGNPIRTFVCQVTNIELGMDLGDVIGYYPLPSGLPNDGLIVSYTHGSPGCAASSPDRKSRFRVANITFLCDSDAGVGLPTDPVENPPCSYNFQWRSLYACPVCSPRDYSFFLTPCDAARSSRRKVYYWIDNPRRCHDGVQLPQDETIVCTVAAAVPCAAGTYLPPGSSECTPTQSGYYSTGDSDIWKYWPADSLGRSVVSPWNTTCSGEGCATWSVTEDGLVKSGSGFSVLRATVTWERSRTGSVVFTYKWGHSNSSDFGVMLNGQSVWQLQKDPKSASPYAAEWNTVTLSGVIGTQVINFVFNSANVNDFVILQSVAFVGIRNNVAYPTPCPAGFFAPAPGASGCLSCPANTRSAAGSASCLACDADEYAAPGSAECTPRPTCAATDFQLTWTACVDGKRNGTYTLLPPAVCSGGRAPANVVGAACQPCPLGTVGVPGSCTPCAAGQYYDTVSRSCQSIPAGYVSPPQLTFWGATDSYAFPTAWTTSCTGNCATNGWRPRGSYVDSGVSLGHEVDMKLRFQFALVAPGYISFDYQLSPEQPAGTSLVAIIDDGAFVDLVPFNGVIRGYKIQLPATTQRVDFLHHMMPNGQPAILGNVTISGIKGGYALRPEPCPAGTQNVGASPTCSPCMPGMYAPAPATATCQQCPVNTYAPDSNSVACTACGTGTVAAAGAKACMTLNNACQFTSPKFNETYDLSVLRRAVISAANAEGFRMTICDPNLACSARSPYTYACFSHDTDSTNVGRRLNFIEGTAPGTFSLTYDKGDNCAGSPVKTTIDFRCANDTARQPTLVTPDPGTGCVAEYKLTWNTILACRTCTDADYDSAATVCTNSVQKIAMVLRPDVLCHGPTRLSEVEAECVEEIAVRPWYLLVTVALLLVLVIVIVFVVMKNRSLAHRYTQLSSISARSANIGGPEQAESLTDAPPGAKETVEHEDL